MNSFGEKVNFIWSIAELLRDTFKRSKYQLPHPFEVNEFDIRTLEKDILRMFREVAG